MSRHKDQILRDRLEELLDDYCDECGSHMEGHSRWCRHAGTYLIDFEDTFEDLEMTDEQKPSIFSDSAIANSLDKLDPPEEGGQVTVAVVKDGYEGKAEVAINPHWSVGAWVKGKWNGGMDWAGLTTWKW